MKTRKIEFRAWDTINEKWINSENVLIRANGEINFIGDFEMFNKHPGMKGGKDSNVLLFQFTGLIDKNRTKIYEGDVLKDRDGNMSIVVWIEEWAMFGCLLLSEWNDYKEGKKLDESMFWMFGLSFEEYIVIGRIYKQGLIKIT